jgi:hypothetical protein
MLLIYFYRLIKMTFALILGMLMNRLASITVIQ